MLFAHLCDIFGRFSCFWTQGWKVRRLELVMTMMMMVVMMMMMKMMVMMMWRKRRRMTMVMIVVLNVAAKQNKSLMDIWIQ